MNGLYCVVRYYGRMNQRDKKGEGRLGGQAHLPTVAGVCTVTFDVYGARSKLEF
jgi:hypothetical protein